MFIRYSLYILLIFLQLSNATAEQVPWHLDKPISQKQLDSMILEACHDTIKVNLMNECAWESMGSDFQYASNLVQEALDLALNKGYRKGIANSYHTLGMLHWYQSNYWLASDYFFRALNIRKQIRDSIGLTRSFNHIGDVYLYHENYDDALIYYEKAKCLGQKFLDSTALVYSLNNIAEVNSQLAKPEEAYHHFQDALNIVKTIGEPNGYAETHTNLGKFHMDQRAFKIASGHFEKALAISKGSGNKYGIARNLNLLSGLFNAQNINHKEALRLAKEALSLAKTINAKSLQSNAMENISNAYAGSKDYEKAYQFRLKHDLLKDQIVKERTESVILEMGTRFKLNEQREELIEKENSLSHKSQMVDHLNNLIFLGIVFLIVVVAGFIYGRVRFQAKTYTLLAKKNDELITSNKALERFAYVASHDLKEPLRSIGSFATLLKRRYAKQVDEDGRLYINYIVNGVNRMYKLLEDLMEYSCLVHNKEVAVSKVDLNEVMNNVKYALSSRISERKVEIDIDQLPVINTNATQMQQLFQNLVNNAIKFNKNDRPRVTVACEKMGRGHLFSVKDNGIGISKQFHDRIFTVFQRLSKEEYTGTGIGLAICKRIIEQHQGSIWVESEEGQGSTFYFTLPGQSN